MHAYVDKKFYSCKKWVLHMSPWEDEVSPPLPERSHGELLDGGSHHGPLQDRWPTAGGAHDDGT
jgi:hypothetical protein